MGSVDEYDPVADAWTPRSAMPTARGAEVAVSLGRIYAIGGFPGPLATNEEATLIASAGQGAAAGAPPSLHRLHLPWVPRDSSARCS